jgi:Tfp pilus assembly protein PilF
LLCAGWLAGRGPLLVDAGETTVPVPAHRQAFRGTHIGRLRLALVAASLVAALLTAWAQWQPKRSNELSNRALNELTSDPAAARADAQGAVSEDPLSADALFTLAEVQNTGGQPLQARDTLQKAVRLQPSNPETWLTLARFDLTSYPAAAAKEFEASIYLDPQSISAEALADNNAKAIEVHNDYLQALRASTAAAAAAKSATATRSRAGAGAKRAGHRQHRRKHRRSRTSTTTP